MFETETVTIDHPDHPGQSMIINKSDFDPAKHKVFEPAASEPEDKPKGGKKPESDTQNPPAGSKKDDKDKK